MASKQSVKFKAQNIHCENCARTIKNALKEDFGEIEVDVASGVVSLSLDPRDEAKFKEEMDDLGFSVAEKLACEN